MNEAIQKKWHDKTVVVVIMLIVFFPVGIYALWQNQFIKKGWKIGITTFIAFILIIGIMTPSSNNHNSSLDNYTQKNNTTMIRSDSISQMKSQITQTIDSLKIPFDAHLFRGSNDALILESAFFSSLAKLIYQAKQYNDKELNKLVAELETKVIKIQINEFPLMRTHYMLLHKHDLWKENIELSLVGKDVNTMQLVGAAFANNKAIDNVQTTIVDVLRALRFKKTIYKWIPSDDSPTIYDLYSSSSDKEIVAN